jgi:hypothetical protein
MKTWVSICLFFLGVYVGYAQPCQPDANATGTGLSPAPLPEGRAGQVYSPQTVTVLYEQRIDTFVAAPVVLTGKIFADFTLTILIDSMRMDSVTGLPPGLTMPISCGTTGNCLTRLSATNIAQNRTCLSLSGTPTSSVDNEVVVWNTAYGTYTVDTNVVLNSVIANLINLPNDTLFKEGVVYDLNNPPDNIKRLAAALNSGTLPGGQAGLDRLNVYSNRGKLRVTGGNSRNPGVGSLVSGGLWVSTSPGEPTTLHGLTPLRHFSGTVVNTLGQRVWHYSGMAAADGTLNLPADLPVGLYTFHTSEGRYLKFRIG